MAALTQTSNEQDQARKAVHWADDEVDLASPPRFGGRRRIARPATGLLHDVIAHIDQLKMQIAADQNVVVQLTKLAGSTNGASDQLELAKARLSLDQDELEETQRDLARQGGDPHTALERALQAHEATQHQAAQRLNAANPVPTATLSQQVGTWLSLREREGQLPAAEQEAAGQQLLWRTGIRT
jgi:hypothetical protein